MYPGATEEECNGLDEDGDGVDPCPDDLDGDGVPAARDCDDRDPRVSPMTGEVPCNGVDENCNGYDDCDTDRDGTLDVFDLDPADPGIGTEEVEALPRDAE